MPFSNVDDIVAEILAGKYQRLAGFRTINTGATSVAGRWHDTFSGGGHGGVGAGAAGAFAASANSLPVGSMFTAGGSAAVLGSNNMNLAAGDSGVRQLDSYTIASGTTGTVTFMLHRPIASIPLVAANVAGERDFLFNLPSLPKIEDDACLAFFVLIGGATVASQQISYELGMGWG